MKASDVANILTKAILPIPTREQLIALAGTGAGKRFADALTGFAGGDTSQRGDLEATVLALAPALHATLKRVGGTATVGQVVGIAQQEQRRFFDAVDAIDKRSARAAAAQRYLAELGLAGAAQPAALTPAPAAVAPPYYNFHIFGSQAALCISEARTKKDNRHTVQIEGAIALAGGGRNKAFDWPNKIAVQLSVQEAYQALALLENKLRSVKFDGHGVAHDKSLHLEFQHSHHYVRLIQRGRAAVSVPVRAVDSIPVVSLLYKQLLANEPHLRIDDIRGLVDRMVSMSAQAGQVSDGR
jgi:hypothetical protein